VHKKNYTKSIKLFWVFNKVDPDQIFSLKDNACLPTSGGRWYGTNFKLSAQTTYFSIATLSKEIAGYTIVPVY